jgi:hypothetical protein
MTYPLNANLIRHSIGGYPKSTMFESHKRSRKVMKYWTLDGLSGKVHEEPDTQPQHPAVKLSAPLTGLPERFAAFDPRATPRVRREGPDEECPVAPADATARRDMYCRGCCMCRHPRFRQIALSRMRIIRCCPHGMRALDTYLIARRQQA